MVLNGKKVLNFLRVSKGLLVCGLEGESTYHIRGDEQYVDGQERKLRDGLPTNAVLTVNSAVPAGLLANDAGEETLVPPVFNAALLGIGVSKQPANPVVQPGAEPPLMLPVYNFAPPQ